LKGVNSTIRSTQTDLKEVEKLLKLDPTNTELLRQKQELLGKSISATNEKLAALKEASANAAKTAGNYDAWKAKYDPIKAQIDETSKKLNELKESSDACDKKMAEGAKAEQKHDKLQKDIQKTEASLEKLKAQSAEADQQLGQELVARKHLLRNFEPRLQQHDHSRRVIGNIPVLPQTLGRVTDAGQSHAELVRNVDCTDIAPLLPEHQHGFKIIFRRFMNVQIHHRLQQNNDSEVTGYGHNKIITWFLTKSKKMKTDMS
jgi:phage-related minor tail protein